MRKKKKVKSENVVVSGKRKTAIARAVISEGDGEIKINSKPIDLFPHLSYLTLKEPLQITQNILPGILQKVNIHVDVKGGGEKSQIEASRLAIARALVAYTKSKELRDAFASYDKHLVVADVRRKEPRKPGDSKARAKRQKSYR